MFVRLVDFHFHYSLKFCSFKYHISILRTEEHTQQHMKFSLLRIEFLNIYFYINYMNKERAYFNENSQTNIDLLFTKALQKIKPEPTGEFPLHELDLQIQNDNNHDRNELIGILTQLLTYPSTQLAEIHRNANRLGSLYLKENQNEDPTDYQRRISTQKICACCGLLQQTNTLIISTGLKNIRHIGVSTYLYFMTIKSVISLVLAMILIYSIFAIITNISASSAYKNSTENSTILVSQKSYEGILLISLGSKQLHATNLDKVYYTIQCWLGVGMIVVWGILFGIIKYLQRLICKQIDNDLRSAADFTVFIKNLPTSMTKQKLTKELNQYLGNLGFSEEINVQKINRAAPYYLERSQFNNENLKKLNEEYKDYEEIFVGWIKERQQNKSFTTPQASRSRIIKEFHELKKKKDQEYLRVEENIKQKMRQKIQSQTVPAFVTFSNNLTAQFLVQTYKKSHSLFDPLFYKKDQKKFYTFSETNQKAQIMGAPQPEDIIWANQGQDFATSFKKRLITYGISLLLLGCSFAAIYGLSSVQYKQTDKHESTSQYISVLISILISIITIIINLILRVLTNFQRISTFSHYQIGLAVKGVIASIINSIVIPILVNYFFKKNLYGMNGLAEDVFYLGITNSFVTPLLTIFNPQYMFNWAIRKYKSRPQSKLYLNQNQLNAFYENLEFQVGYQYIYVVNLFLFTCFFVSLQPIIAIFALVGFSFTYWVKKFSLFDRSQKPIPGNNSINTAIYQLIYLGPAVYTVGSFSWSNFFEKQQFIGIAPNLVAAILSGILFLIPYKKLTKKICRYQEQKKRIYLQDRIYLPSEYDRLNPMTSAESIKQYKNFISHAVLDPKNDKQLLHLQNELVKMRGLGNRNYRSPVFDQFFNVFNFGQPSYNSNQIMLNKIYDNKANTFNPLLLLNMTMPNSDSAFKMGVQNWFKNGQNAQKKKVPGPGENLNIGRALGENIISDYDQVLKVNDNGLMVVSKILEENHNHDTNRPVLKYTQEKDIGDQNMDEMNNITGGNIPMNLTMNMFGNLFTSNSKRKSINPNNQLTQQPLYLNFLRPNQKFSRPQQNPMPNSSQKFIGHENYTQRDYENPFDQIMNHNNHNLYPHPQPQMNPYEQMFTKNYYPNSNYPMNSENQRGYRG